MVSLKLYPIIYINTCTISDNPDAPLFINTGNTNFGERLTYQAARNRLQKAVKVAGVNRRIWFHLFRHTEATKSAGVLTDSQQRKRHGWAPKSTVAARYDHINDEDVSKTWLKSQGVSLDDDEEIKNNLPVLCPICKAPNSKDVDFCENCGKGMTLEKVVLHEEQDKKEIIEALIPDITKAVMESLGAHQSEIEVAIDDMTPEQMKAMIKKSMRN